METPVSIVIPTLNEEAYLPKLLESLAHIDSPLDIIVVDGHSEDKTPDIVRSFQSRFFGNRSLRLIEFDQRNISLQRNAGAAVAQHEVLMFCDADILIPNPEAFAVAIEGFQQNQYVVAAPRLVPIERGFRIALLSSCAFAIQKACVALGKPYFAGMCLVTRKSVFAAVGGFDDTVAIGEDIDYSMRATAHGAFGLLPVQFPASARRVIEYGYWWMIKETPSFLRLLFTGKAHHIGHLEYPFGEFGEITAPDSPKRVNARQGTLQ